MLAKLVRATPNALPHAFGRTLTAKPCLPIRQFSTSFYPMAIPQQVPIETEDNTLDNLPSINPHVSTYMKDLSQYLTAASAIGISSAHLLALTAPLGFSPAFLILTGFGLQHVGSDFVDKAKPNAFIYRDTEGKMQYGSSNSPLRKLGFLTSCLGYSCIIGSLLGMVPLAPAALPVSALTCLFSTLGQLGYCKFAKKKDIKPVNLLISGVLSGVMGLNFLTSSSVITMWESVLHLQNLETSSYLGLLLYNLFTTGSENQKTVGDVHDGKGDYLKHANKFSENWLYALIPHFLMNL